MREILFRGKRLNDEENEWAYGSYVKQYECDMIYFPSAESDGFDYAHIIPETVGQFTGLTDKNGTKIFEGDVVLIKTKRESICKETRDEEYTAIAVVEFSSGMFDFNGKGLALTTYWGLKFLSLQSSFSICEVIGNIIDNPELLNN